MLSIPKYSTLCIKCNENQYDKFSYSQRKILHLLDIEISNKNPYVICQIECRNESLIFTFDNGVFNVKHETSSTEALIQKVISFKESIKYLECDLGATNFLQNEIQEQELKQRQKYEGTFVRYKLRLQSTNLSKIYKQSKYF